MSESPVVVKVTFISFASAGVEFLETAAIAYALGRAGYRLEAVVGTIVGTVGVFIPAVFAWPLLARVPIFFFQMAVGAMLLWLGSSWVIKSVRRKIYHQRAGWIGDPLRKHRDHVETKPTSFSYFNLLVMTKSAAIEGFEVCMIVTALALASGGWISAVLGAAAALIATVAIVFLLHGHLQKVPEVSFKLWTGALLCCIGLFWIFQGASTWIHQTTL